MFKCLLKWYFPSSTEHPAVCVNWASSSQTFLLYVSNCSITLVCILTLLQETTGINLRPCSLGTRQDPCTHAVLPYQTALYEQYSSMYRQARHREPGQNDGVRFFQEQGACNTAFGSSIRYHMAIPYISEDQKAFEYLEAIKVYQRQCPVARRFVSYINTERKCTLNNTFFFHQMDTFSKKKNHCTTVEHVSACFCSFWWTCTLDCVIHWCIGHFVTFIVKVCYISRKVLQTCKCSYTFDQPMTV